MCTRAWMQPHTPEALCGGTLHGTPAPRKNNTKIPKFAGTNPRCCSDKAGQDIFFMKKPSRPSRRQTHSWMALEGQGNQRRLECTQ